MPTSIQFGGSVKLESRIARPGGTSTIQAMPNLRAVVQSLQRVQG